MRIFPEMWASTLWPFSSSTRNMAFGNGSMTVPSRTIASSLGLGSADLQRLARAGIATHSRLYMGAKTHHKAEGRSYNSPSSRPTLGDSWSVQAAERTMAYGIVAGLVV